MADTALLNDVALFTELSTDELALLAAAAERHELQRNDLLFAEGDEPDRLYVVVSRAGGDSQPVDRRPRIDDLVDGAGRPVRRDAPVRRARPLRRGPGPRASEVLSIPYGPLQEIYERGPPCCGAS